MLVQAAQIIYDAHQHGMLSVLWIYPRGAAVKDEKDPHLIAGATGVGACLGTDFVKVNYPKKEGAKSAEIFKEAVKAAGRTKVVCAGGTSDEAEAFLKKNSMTRSIFPEPKGMQPGEISTRNTWMKLSACAMLSTP